MIRGAERPLLGLISDEGRGGRPSSPLCSFTHDHHHYTVVASASVTAPPYDSMSWNPSLENVTYLFFFLGAVVPPLLKNFLRRFHVVPDDNEPREPPKYFLNLVLGTIGGNLWCFDNVLMQKCSGCNKPSFRRRSGGFWAFCRKTPATVIETKGTFRFLILWASF